MCETLAFIWDKKLVFNIFKIESKSTHCFLNKKNSYKSKNLIEYKFKHKAKIRRRILKSQTTHG